MRESAGKLQNLFLNYMSCANNCLEKEEQNQALEYYQRVIAIILERSNGKVYRFCQELLKMVLEEAFKLNFKLISTKTQESFVNELIKINSAFCVNMGVKEIAAQLNQCITDEYINNLPYDQPLNLYAKNHSQSYWGDGDGSKKKKKIEKIEEVREMEVQENLLDSENKGPIYHWF